MDNTNNAQTFYYTFGTADFYPYKKGWVEVKAEDRAHADALFRQHFPDRTSGVLNCSCVYSEEHFHTIQHHANNLPDWKICHAVITSNSLEPTAPVRSIPKRLADLLTNAKTRTQVNAMQQSQQHTVEPTR